MNCYKRNWSKRGLLIGLVGALFVLPCSANDFYIAPLVGYSFNASDFDVADTEVGYSGKLGIDESNHAGIMFGLMTRDPGNMYFLYSHQHTDMRSLGAATQPFSELEIDYIHLGGTLYFPKGKFSPYVTASAGLTQFRPNGNWSNETKFSMAVGIGAEYAITDSFAIYSDLRGYATFVNSSNELFCDANQCVWNINADLFWQGQLNAGFKYRF